MTTHRRSQLLLHSVLSPRRFCYRALNWKWIGQLGILSYSIYIWQQIFCTKPEVFGVATVWWMSFPGWLVPAFAAAFASYYLLERPLLALRAKFRPIPETSQPLKPLNQNEEAARPKDHPVLRGAR